MIKKPAFYGHFYTPKKWLYGSDQMEPKNGSHPVPGGADRGDEAMTREREQWTRFVEEREAEQKAKRPRSRRSPRPTPAELEQALDDLVDEAEQRRPTG